MSDSDRSDDTSNSSIASGDHHPPPSGGGILPSYPPGFKAFPWTQYHASRRNGAFSFASGGHYPPPHGGMAQGFQGLLSPHAHAPRSHDFSSLASGGHSASPSSDMDMDPSGSSGSTDVSAANAPRLEMPSGSLAQRRSKQRSKKKKPKNPASKRQLDDQHARPPALFLSSDDGYTEELFPKGSPASAGSGSGGSAAVSSATISVRPIATYTEAHRKGDKPTFEPWKQEEGKHPTPLAYDFVDTFPSIRGKRRRSLPDSKYFRYKRTMYDPTVSVVEAALRVPGVRENLTKYPDVLGDGVGLLAAILKRSLGLPQACARQKRRSIVRLSPRESQSSSINGCPSSSDTRSAEHGEAKQTEAQGPLRLFCDNPALYLDRQFFGPRFEYICTQPDDAGDNDLKRKGLHVQPYGGFRVILEVTLTPEHDAKDAAADVAADAADATPKVDCEPITILMCSEVDASDARDPNKWVELRSSTKKKNRTKVNKATWCQAVLTGCQQVVTLFHENGKIDDIEAFDVSATESTPLVQNPKQHFGYMYNALKSMSRFAQAPDRKYVVTERANHGQPSKKRKLW